MATLRTELKDLLYQHVIAGFRNGGVGALRLIILVFLLYVVVRH